MMKSHRPIDKRLKSFVGSAIALSIAIPILVALFAAVIVGMVFAIPIMAARVALTPLPSDRPKDVPTGAENKPDEMEDVYRRPCPRCGLYWLEDDFDLAANHLRPCLGHGEKIDTSSQPN